MPVYNGETTIIKTLESLSRQTLKPDEIIIINDGSNDRSLEILKNSQLDFKFKLIVHDKCWGLAKTYNEGIRCSSADLIVTMHQDIILIDNDCLKILIAPFIDNAVVASSHIVAHPMDVWKKYNFWQKCFFSRLAGKDFSGIDGKFDCFRKESLKKIGLFDEVHFRSAGEDGDIVFRLKKIGRIIGTQAKIIHLHKISQNFSPSDIIQKQKQYSEAQGTLFSLGRIQEIRLVLRTFFREILIILLFIPGVQMISLLMILIYSFYYSKTVFFNEYKDKRIFALPFLNIYLLLVSFIYSTKGIIYGKQQI